MWRVSVGVECRGLAKKFEKMRLRIELASVLMGSKKMAISSRTLQTHVSQRVRDRMTLRECGWDSHRCADAGGAVHGLLARAVYTIQSACKVRRPAAACASRRPVSGLLSAPLCRHAAGSTRLSRGDTRACRPPWLLSAMLTRRARRVAEASPIAARWRGPSISS